MLSKYSMVDITERVMEIKKLVGCKIIIDSRVRNQEQTMERQPESCRSFDERTDQASFSLEIGLLWIQVEGNDEKQTTYISY